jgi:hypothetical protein
MKEHEFEQKAADCLENESLRYLLTGQLPESITPGRMTYDLAGGGLVGLHGFIERLPWTHR